MHWGRRGLSRIVIGLIKIQSVPTSYLYCHPNRPVPLLSLKQTRTPIVTQTDPYPYCHSNRLVDLEIFSSQHRVYF